MQQENSDSGALGSTMAEVDPRKILTFDQMKPKECIYCFSTDPQTERVYGGFDCFCSVCGRSWHEKIMHDFP